MIIIIASIVVVISIAASYYFSSNINESDISEKIVITKYKYTYIEDKKIIIDSKKEKKFISEKSYKYLYRTGKIRVTCD